MSVSMTARETIEVAGFSFPALRTISADGVIVKTATLAVAKVGQLTTRTSDSAGELTMDAGHGITTGQRLDLYWTGGYRRGITVGTVATNQVPLTTATGAGDVLPTNLTAVTAQVPTEEELVFTGSNAAAIAYYTQRTGIIVLAESDETEADAANLAAGVSDVWFPNRDATVPTDSQSVTKVYLSNGDSSNTSEARVAVMYS